MPKQEVADSIRVNISVLARPPSRMPVADAVRDYMRVPMGAGNAVSWDPMVAPYIIEPMNCLTSREYDAVIFVGPARTGKTIGLVDGWVIYNIVCDPSDMLVVQISEEKAREHSKKRLARTFRLSPEVSKRLSPNRNDNNVHDKTFLAGNYLKLGWPSINIMSSSDYKCVALTDYDRMNDDIDGEGDGFSLASKRTTTFMSSGMTLAESSPGRDIVDTKWRPTSEHEAPPATGILSLYNRGDRRQWYWPCPHCNHFFRPDGNSVSGYQEIKDPVAASEAAFILCPHCAGKITPEKKRELNARGIWLRDGETVNADGVLGGEPRRSRIASFWMQGPAAAYQSLSQLVYKRLVAEHEYEATGSEETLKAVINTDWGQPYLPRSAIDQRRSDELMARAENYGKRLIPPKVRFLEATVDVQGGKNRRFVVQIIGYGQHGERWVIDRYNIKTSMRYNEDGEALKIDPAGYPEDWDLLISDVLEKEYPLLVDERRKMGIQWMAVDSGGEDGVTGNAYKFWRYCKKNGLKRKVYLFKGDSHARNKLVSRFYPDNTKRSDRSSDARGDVPLYLLQTDQLKDRVAAALSRETPGPNFIHFPEWLGEWFYDELTYEERGADGKWKKPGKGANEALDLMCYADALALLKGYDKIDWTRPPSWAQEQVYSAGRIQLTRETDEPVSGTEPQKTPQSPRPKKTRGFF